MAVEEEENCDPTSVAVDKDVFVHPPDKSGRNPDNGWKEWRKKSAEQTTREERAMFVSLRVH